MGLKQEVDEDEEEDMPVWGDVGSKDEWGFTLPQDKETLMKGVLSEGEIKENTEIWFYKDPQGKTQGPFKTDKIIIWKKFGYFDDDLPLS